MSEGFDFLFVCNLGMFDGSKSTDAYPTLAMDAHTLEDVGQVKEQSCQSEIEIGFHNDR